MGHKKKKKVTMIGFTKGNINLNNLKIIEVTRKHLDEDQIKIILKFVLECLDMFKESLIQKEKPEDFVVRLDNKFGEIPLELRNDAFSVYMEAVEKIYGIQTNEQDKN